MTSALRSETSLSPERILEVATEQFYERGYRATTMRDIAAAVGVKAGSLYNHYASKQDILVRLCRETSQRLHDGAVNRIEGVGDVEQALRTYVIWHVSFHAENRHGSRVTDTQLSMIDPEHRSALIEIRDAHEQLLRDILERGARERRWSSQNLRIVSIAIETMCNEVAAWYRDDGPLSPEGIGELYAEFILSGLGGE
jgi:AcrR family transcriptional regulator